MGHYDLGWRLWRQNPQMIDDIALQVEKSSLDIRLCHCHQKTN